MTVGKLKEYLDYLIEEGRSGDNLRFACYENDNNIDGVFVCGSYRTYTEKNSNKECETVLIIVSKNDSDIKGNSNEM